MSTANDPGIGFGLVPPAFHFRVRFANASDAMDTSFQEVTGLEAEMTTEDLVEGGENRFVHRLPTGVRHPALELKRAIAPLDSPLVAWCQSIMEGGLAATIETQQLSVSLLDEKREPIRSWTVSGAYPTKWAVDGFDSTKNEVAIETVILSYATCERTV